MKRAYSIYVADILGAMEAVARFVAGMTYEAFASEVEKQYAVLWGFTIIGEAAKQVPEEVCQRAPEVDWRGMAGMRDRLVHGYHGINLRVAWDAIHERFPIELPALRRLLAELDAEEEQAE